LILTDAACFVKAYFHIFRRGLRFDGLPIPPAAAAQQKIL